jgi:hypothetical protein
MKSEDEKKALAEFSNIACQTDNPDLLWALAHHESRFQFNIAVVNKMENGRASPMKLKDQKAKTFLTSLGQSQDKNKNVDVGVLQINWGAHGKYFNYEATRILSPEDQVKYVVNNMMGPLTEKCGPKWVACYHSWSNPKLQKKYYALIQGSLKSMHSFVEDVLRLRLKQQLDGPSVRIPYALPPSSDGDKNLPSENQDNEIDNADSQLI